MSNNKSDQIIQQETTIIEGLKGIGRLWFLIIFSSLFVLVSIIPDWSTLSNEVLKLHSSAVNLTQSNVLENSIVSITLQILIWNFILAVVTAPVFYLRIINIRIANSWILALVIPFVWSVLFIRCLVYQPGYTHSGTLDAVGIKILKIVTYLMYVIILLSVTYLLADIF